MREIAVDTETTGLDPGSGHRIVELGCVELNRHVPTGEVFHRYLNPDRDMPDEAFRVHGLSNAFLAGQPRFAEVVEDFLEFLGDAPLIIHNAKFDMGFINAELARLDRQPLPDNRAVDTIGLARQRFPGAQVSLDALCRRFELDLSARTKHGALLDAELLADVYLELRGGRQPDLDLSWQREELGQVTIERTMRPARPHAPSAAELSAHSQLLQQLKEPIWLR